MEEKRKIPDFSVVESVYQEQVAFRDTRRSLVTTIIVILCSVALAAILALIIFPIEKIDGDNLSPELDNNDICLLMKKFEYRRGDLVCFAYGDFVLVKRVVGVSGDYIDFNDEGELLVNNRKVNEDYVINDKSGDYENIYPYQVPDGCYFVLSDNREIMTDSRSAYVGAVKQDIVVGKFLFRFWPLDKFKWLI